MGQVERAALLIDAKDLPAYLLKPKIHTLLDHARDATDRFLMNTLWHTGALFGKSNLVLAWGSCDTDRGGMSYRPIDPREGVGQAIEKIVKRRLLHGYHEV